MTGGLLVAGTSSEAGKSLIVAGVCRWLAREGVRVAPFKAQNMALNAVATGDGVEIGRAQAMQAAAAGAAPEAAMNPILLKPTGEASSQVVVMGAATGVVDARSYPARKQELRAVVRTAFADLAGRYDVVVCEGAGSPTEINLRADDLANMGLAREAELPVIVVGDIDRGGVFAALYGTLALLEPADQRLVAGFVINKFRGDPGVLAPGLAQLAELTGRATLGVLPWQPGLWLDAEDSLALESRGGEATPPRGPDGIDVAVVRLRRLSNFTDFDALACEPGVVVRFTTNPVDVARADLAVVPGTKATVEDLAFVRERGIDAALAARARRGDPVLGICGGYQLLGDRVDDEVESGAGSATGLGLLPVTTRFASEKVLARRTGTSPAFADCPAGGYEIRHGRVARHGGQPLLVDDAGEPDGCVNASVLGTSWHGLLEHDTFRRRLLGWVAGRRGLEFLSGERSFAAAREAQLDALGDLVEDHCDTAALRRLVAEGAPAGLPVLGPDRAPAPAVAEAAT